MLKLSKIININNEDYRIVIKEEEGYFAPVIKATLHKRRSDILWEAQDEYDWTPVFTREFRKSVSEPFDLIKATQSTVKSYLKRVAYTDKQNALIEEFTQWHGVIEDEIQDNE